MRRPASTAAGDVVVEDEQPSCASHNNPARLTPQLTPQHRRSHNRVQTAIVRRVRPAVGLATVPVVVWVPAAAAATAAVALLGAGRSAGMTTRTTYGSSSSCRICLQTFATHCRTSSSSSCLTKQTPCSRCVAVVAVGVYAMRGGQWCVLLPHLECHVVACALACQTAPTMAARDNPYLPYTTNYSKEAVRPPAGLVSAVDALMAGRNPAVIRMHYDELKEHLHSRWRDLLATVLKTKKESGTVRGGAGPSVGHSVPMLTVCCVCSNDVA